MKDNKKKYTANIHNTGSLIDESKRILRLYSELKDEKRVKEVLLKKNPLNKESEGSIEKIFFITRKRYLRQDPWPLIELIESDLPPQTIEAVMFYYFAKSDNLVYDITTELLFNLYLKGHLTVTKNDVEEYLNDKEEKHPEISEWSITTRNKTIRHYLAA
ncbi:MAG: BrxA family protein, partial [Candidatus Aenigmatarchaeota archaeon]